MDKDTLLLGIDGGGTRCRARLCAASGAPLGEGEAGAANIRLGIERSFEAVLLATRQSLAQAGLAPEAISRITACLALAGASEPGDLAAAQDFRHPFRRAIVTTDAHAACVGAHGGQDGGVIVLGTGSIGWAEIEGRAHRVGGWGLPISDEASGAWLGMEALRRVLWANDRRRAWTPLLRALFAGFASDPHAIVRFAAEATPRDYAALAPTVTEHAERQDPAGIDLMRSAAGHVDAIAIRLIALGAERIALTGGVAAKIEPWLAPMTRRRLVAPAGDALDGALRLARMAAEAPTVPDHPLPDHLVLQLG